MKVKIICPGCEAIQEAEVWYVDELSPPVYVHKCVICEYMIMESEWEEVDD